MTAVSGQLFASGHRFATAFALSATTGFIAPPTADTAYYGSTIQSSKAYQGNYPEPRKITHYGQDRVQQVDFLPPIESMDAQIQASATDYDFLALVSGTKVHTLGTMKFLNVLTNKQGYEPSIGLFLYQQALDLALGIRRWQAFTHASAKCVFKPQSQTETTDDIIFKLVPAISKQALWGTALTEADNGTLISQMGMFMTEGLPSIVAWKAGGAATDYTLGTGRDALNATTAWLVCTINGVEFTPSAYTTTKISVAAPHTAGDIVVAVYESIANF